MRIAAIGLGVLVALGSGAALAAGGGSAPSGGGSFNMPERQMTPEEQAKQAYNQGVRAVKAADKLAKSAEETTDEKKKAKVLDKAKHQYENARGYFASALQRKVDMYEAWNYVGYTSRKLGEYDKALQAYDEALRLNPKLRRGDRVSRRGVSRAQSHRGCQERVHAAVPGPASARRSVDGGDAEVGHGPQGRGQRRARSRCTRAVDR
jgi:hypothetical protein